MKAARLIWLVFALAFLVNRSAFPAGVVCDNNGCISVTQFAANISQALNNNVVGYVGTVGSQVISGGYARTGADAPVPMNPNLPSSVASLSKTLTAIGVLKELAVRNLTIDAYIYPFLPPGWGTTSTGAPAPNVNTITFRQLLTHTSGFQSCVDPSAPPPGPGVSCSTRPMPGCSGWSSRAFHFQPVTTTAIATSRSFASCCRRC